MHIINSEIQQDESEMDESSQLQCPSGSPTGSGEKEKVVSRPSESSRAGGCGVFRLRISCKLTAI